MTCCTGTELLTEPISYEPAANFGRPVEVTKMQHADLRLLLDHAWIQHATVYGDVVDGDTDAETLIAARQLAGLRNMLKYKPSLKFKTSISGRVNPAECNVFLHCLNEKGSWLPKEMLSKEDFNERKVYWQENSSTDGESKNL